MKTGDKFTVICDVTDVDGIFVKVGEEVVYEYDASVVDYGPDSVICRTTSGLIGEQIVIPKNLLKPVAPLAESDKKNKLDITPEKLMEMIGANESKRYNSGKIQTREIDPAFILGIGEVLTKSRAKYAQFNWAKPTKLSTPMESLERHLLAFKAGENFDKETQSHHLLHAATNIMFMYYHIVNNPEYSDDRFFKKDKK